MCFSFFGDFVHIFASFPSTTLTKIHSIRRRLLLKAQSNIMVSPIVLFKRKSSQTSAFRKGDKKRTLKGFFRKSSKKKNKEQSLPFLSQNQSQTLTWTLSEDTDVSQHSTSYNDMCHGPACQLLGSNYSQEAVEALRRRHEREIKALQEQISSLQETMNELNENESEYQTLCDQYEKVAHGQELEISKKEYKIVYLKRFMEALESRNTEETRRRKELEKNVSKFKLSGEQYERVSRDQRLEIFKRELEIEFQKGMNETLVLLSQAEKQRLNDRASEHEKEILDLKENLVIATQQNLEQAKEIEGLKQKLLDILKKQDLAAAAKAKVKTTKASKPQWSIWDELILD